MRRVYSKVSDGEGVMVCSRTYEGWWDLSLIDERNERPLRAAFVAVIAAWGTAVLLALALV
jgi:hypothetical protein